jgi:phosphoribosylformimino-5-aminoimidazole carboxamide ribotide isomerase
MVDVKASRFEILPAIDLRAGRVVRLREGDFDRETGYDVDPAVAALKFADAGARWIHVVDLDAARTGEPSSAAAIEGIVRAVGERLSVELAGGIRSIPTADAAIAAGASRVVVGTAALEDPTFVGRLIGKLGAQRVAIALDVRDDRAVGHGWQEVDGGVPLEEALGAVADEGATTFEVTSVVRDGLLEGPDLALLERVVAEGRGEVIASGGITTLDDLRAVREIGCSGAIIGRALYEGRLDLQEALLRLASG